MGGDGYEKAGGNPTPGVAPAISLCSLPGERFRLFSPPAERGVRRWRRVSSKGQGTSGKPLVRTSLLHSFGKF